jgi:hypothetical protein
MLKEGKKQAEIGDIFGVSSYVIHDIKRKRSWKHI